MTGMTVHDCVWPCMTVQIPLFLRGKYELSLNGMHWVDNNAPTMSWWIERHTVELWGQRRKDTVSKLLNTILRKRHFYSPRLPAPFKYNTDPHLVEGHGVKISSCWNCWSCAVWAFADWAGSCVPIWKSNAYIMPSFPHWIQTSGLLQVKRWWGSKVEAGVLSTEALTDVLMPCASCEVHFIVRYQCVHNSLNTVQSWLCCRPSHFTSTSSISLVLSTSTDLNTEFQSAFLGTTTSHYYTCTTLIHFVLLLEHECITASASVSCSSSTSLASSTSTTLVSPTMSDPVINADTSSSSKGWALCFMTIAFYLALPDSSSFPSHFVNLSPMASFCFDSTSRTSTVLVSPICWVVACDEIHVCILWWGRDHVCSMAIRFIRGRCFPCCSGFIHLEIISVSMSHILHFPLHTWPDGRHMLYMIPVFIITLLVMSILALFPVAYHFDSTSSSSWFVSLWPLFFHLFLQICEKFLVSLLFHVLFNSCSFPHCSRSIDLVLTLCFTTPLHNVKVRALSSLTADFISILSSIPILFLRYLLHTHIVCYTHHSP